MDDLLAGRPGPEEPEPAGALEDLGERRELGNLRTTGNVRAAGHGVTVAAAVIGRDERSGGMNDDVTPGIFALGNRSEAVDLRHGVVHDLAVGG